MIEQRRGLDQGSDGADAGAPARPAAPFEVVTLATSLGGFAALTAVLAPLPPDFCAAIVVVQHLSARYPSALVERLGRGTALPVAWAVPGQRLCSGRIYVAPPNQHTLVAPDSTFALTQGPRLHFSRPAADPLLVSVARRYGERTIAVILTGAGGDGAAGAWAVKARGGRVLVQEAATARARGMPSAALRMGCADFALPLDRIASAVVALVMVPGAAALLRVPLRGRDSAADEAMHDGWGSRGGADALAHRRH